MNNKFLQVCLGISMIILASGFFVRSFSTAKAAPGPQSPMTVGRYQVAFGHGNGNANALKLVIWDTQTGHTKLYQVNDLIAPSLLELPMFPLDK